MLSVVITAWNEAENLPRVVKSVMDLADEIVVIDTGSTDDTVAVANKLGCHVYHHKNTGIVEPVRNFSISKAKGDWVLLLDADEEVSSSLAKAISQAIETDSADYYRLPRKNIIFGKWIKSSHWWPDYVYRLFKKGFIVWGQAIHSVPVTRGRGADFPPDSDHALVHHHYSSVFQYVDRINRYTDHQLQLLIDQPVKFTWPMLLTKPGEEFIRQFFARHGYKDGVHGLGLAGLQAFSELVLYLKLWQVSGFPEEQVSLSGFNKTTTSLFKQLRWWIYEQKGPVYKIWRKIKTFII